VTDIEDVVELLVLQDEARVGLKSGLDGYLGGTLSQGVVLSLYSNHVGEKSVDEAHEDGYVDLDDLSDVEVSQGSEEDDVLIFVGGCGTLELTSLSQERLDGSETPIVVSLLGEE
jgi:hypothetical protein